MGESTTERPTVLLDVDGVLADFIGAVLRSLSALVPGRRHVHEDITRFDFVSELKLTADEKKAVMSAIGGKEFWPRIDPFPGAREGVARLREIADVYIVTSPWNSCETWLHARESWLRRHFDIPHSHVLAGSAKHICAGDYFVDDKTETLQRWRAARGRVGTAIQWETPHNRFDGWNGPSTRSWDQLCSWVGESMRVPSQVESERDALYDALERLVRERKSIEFSTPPQQASMRNARALLAEIQRTPKEPPK